MKTKKNKTTIGRNGLPYISDWWHDSKKQSELGQC